MPLLIVHIFTLCFKTYRDMLTTCLKICVHDIYSLLKICKQCLKIFCLVFGNDVEMLLQSFTLFFNIIRNDSTLFEHRCNLGASGFKLDQNG